MALNNFGLGFAITANDEASAVFNKVGGSLGKLEKDGAASAISLQEAGEKLKSMGEKFSHFSDIITDTLLGAAESAGEFEAQIRTAGAFAGATGAQLDAMRAAAMDTDLVMKGFSFTDQAKAMSALANETNSATAAMQELKPALIFAKITGTDAATAAISLADILKGMGKTSADAEDVVDKLAFATKRFGLNAADLQNALLPTIGAARLMGGTFEDTLAVVGIANSGLGNIRKAAMAATMAMNQLSDPSTQADFAKLGISVKNTDGTFRNMTDILGDVADKTKGMTAAQKAATLSNIYNAKTAGGLNIVIDQLSKGVKDAAGNILTGAAAAAELRRQMDASKGAAEELSEAAVGTFADQKKALSAALSSFMTTIGEPIQAMLAPIVRNIVIAITKITNGFNSLSPGLKKVLVGVVAAVAGVTAFIGALLTGAGAVAGLLLAGEALVVGLGVVAGLMQGIAIAMVPLTLAAVTLYMVWTKNIGGIQQRVQVWVDKIKLAFTALQEVFSTGGFSMAVFSELNKAENSGIKAFAINAFLWFNRIKNFFSKLGDAFTTGMQKIGPTLDRIFDAIARIAGHFGMATDAASKNKDAFERWGAIGAKVGDALAWVVEKIAMGVLKVVSFVEGFSDVFSGFSEVFAAVKDAVEPVFQVFGDLFKLFSSGKEDAATQSDIFRTLGQIIGFTANVALNFFVVQMRIVGGVISFVSGVIEALIGWFQGFTAMFSIGVKFVSALLSGNWSQAWDLAKQGVETWAKTILNMFLSVVAGAAGMIDSLGKIFNVDLGLKSKVQGFQANVGAPGSSPAATASPPGLPSASTTPTPSTTPALAQAQASNASTSSIAAAVAAKPAAAQDINLKTTIQIDGQTVADAVQKANTQTANRSFAPTAPNPT